MDSFKRNIILLTMLIIVILYMINTANADDLSTAKCYQELQYDKYSIKEEDMNDNIINAKRDTESFTTPHGKVYHILISEYEVIWIPTCFCPWISGDENYVNESNIELWNILVNLLIKYTRLNNCLAELNADGYFVNDPQSLENAPKPTDTYIPTSAYGKIYYKTMIVYEVNFVPMFFCLWIHGDIDGDLDYNLQWEMLNVELTYFSNRLIWENIDDQDCLRELSKGGFSIYLEHGTKHTEHAQKILARFKTPPIKTPHSKAYSIILTDNKIDIFPKTFCLWIKGNLNRNELWYTSKKNVFYYTCITQLIQDEFNVKNPTKKPIVMNLNDKIENAQTPCGIEFGQITLAAKKKQCLYQTVDFYCNNYSITQMAPFMHQN